jgi:hypothetical protein
MSVMGARGAGELPERKRVGVVGDANVGKSTLLNALVIGDRVLLPSAGIGSVTAAPTRLLWAKTPEVTIRYHSPSRAIELCYALECLHALEGGEPVRERDYPMILESVRLQLREDACAELARERGAAPRRWRNILLKARTLVLGDPVRSVPLATLRAGLRHLVGLPTTTGTERWCDERIVFRLHQLLRSGRTTVGLSFDDDEYAWDMLRVHVSGPLSVLTSEVTVRWPSALLETGLELADLPGLGVSFDAHQQVTDAWLRDALDGVLIVCNRAGLSSSVVEALATSGILVRLVRTWHAQAPSILVAVTKLDDEAGQLRRSSSAGTYLQHYESLASSIQHVVRSQLADILRRMVPAEDARRLEAVAAATPVIAVAAPSYLRLASHDDEVPSIFAEAAQTNIPELARLLARLAASSRGPSRIVRRSVQQRHGARSEV